MAREATCSECDQELGIDRIARLDDEAGALCEDCASAHPDPVDG